MGDFGDVKGRADDAFDELDAAEASGGDFEDLFKKSREALKPEDGVAMDNAIGAREAQIDAADRRFADLSEMANSLQSRLPQPVAPTADIGRPEQKREYTKLSPDLLGNVNELSAKLPDTITVQTPTRNPHMVGPALRGQLNLRLSGAVMSALDVSGRFNSTSVLHLAEKKIPASSAYPNVLTVQISPEEKRALVDGFIRDNLRSQ